MIMHRHRTIIVLVCLIGAPGRTDHARVMGQGSSPSAESAVRETGERLLRRARSAGFAEGAGSIEDVEWSLYWTAAAQRVAPDLAESHQWEASLLDALDRPVEAVAALVEYCRLSPDDVAARIELFIRELERRQTATERIDYCHAVLQAVSPRDQAAETTDAGGRERSGTATAIELTSEIHFRLAELYHGVGDPARSREHLDRALDAFACHTPARMLRWEWFGSEDGSTDPARRAAAHVESLLNLLVCNPGRADLAWQLARELDTLRQWDDAHRWYRHAYAVLAPESDDVPDALLADVARLLIDLAHNRSAAERFDDALEHARRAAELGPDLLAAHYVVIDVARRLGRDALADEHTESARQRCAAIEAAILNQSEHEPAPADAAQAAWFYLEQAPDPQRARLLAEFAARRDPAAAPILALARLAQSDFAGAEPLVAPTAATDAFAALALAKIELATDRRSEGLATLRHVTELAGSGIAYRLAAQTLKEHGAPPAASPAAERVATRLQSVDGRAARFPFAPGEFVELQLDVSDSDVELGEVVRCTLTLVNRGPCPLTLGPDAMLLPEVVLHAEVAGGAHALPAAGRFAVYPGRSSALVSISLARRHVLLPGQRIRVEDVLDAEPLTALMNAEPQRPRELTLTAILDPVQTSDGAITSRLRNFPAPSASLRRAALPSTSEGRRALFERLRAASVGARVVTVRQIAALLAGRHAPELSSSTRDSAGTPVDDAFSAMRVALQDPHPAVRTEAILALESAGIATGQVNELAAALHDRHWLVRMASVDVLARLQGNVFSPVAESISRTDGDELVRAVAGWHVGRWASPVKSDGPTSDDPAGSPGP